MSIKIEDLSKVEVKEGGGGNVLPIGRNHVCRVIDATEMESSKGHPQIMLTFECVEGEHKGKTIRDWWTFVADNPTNMSINKRNLLAMQYEIPEGDFDLKCGDLIGRPVEITVAPKQRYGAPAGEMVNAVKFYDRSSLVFEQAPVSASVDVPF